MRKKTAGGSNIRTKYAGKAAQGTCKRRNSSWLDIKKYT